MHLIKIICLFILLNFTFALSAQLSEDAYVSLITCGPGDEIFTSWGHTAIRVVDKQNKINHIFNYGMFSFEEPNFLLKFLKGKLTYWIGTENFDSFYYQYNSEKRTVYEQKLNLGIQEKNKIYQALSENLKPENRLYLYDFFFDNCCTRPRDILLKQMYLETNIKEETNVTFRQLIDAYIHHKSWTDFGVDLIIGSIADRKSTFEEQMFLPKSLSQQLDLISLGDKDIVESTTILLDFESENARRQKSTLFKPLYIFFLFLAFELWLLLKYRNKETPQWLKKYDNIWFFIFGLSSILIALMWFGTDHIATKDNLNLLWLNPLFLVLLFYRKKSLKIAILGCLILTLIGSTFFQEIHMASIVLIIMMILKLVRNLDVKHKA